MFAQAAPLTKPDKTSELRQVALYIFPPYVADYQRNWHMRPLALSPDHVAGPASLTFCDWRPFCSLDARGGFVYITCVFGAGPRFGRLSLSPPRFSLRMTLRFGAFSFLLLAFSLVFACAPYCNCACTQKVPE